MKKGEHFQYKNYTKCGSTKAILTIFMQKGHKKFSSLKN